MSEEIVSDINNVCYFIYMYSWNKKFTNKNILSKRKHVFNVLHAWLLHCKEMFE